MMQKAQKDRDRRATVPLQHATDFADETGQYDLESIAQESIESSGLESTNVISPSKSFAKPRPKIIVEASKTGQIDDDQLRQVTKQVSFGKDVPI